MLTEHSSTRKPDPMLRPSEVMALTGLSRTTIWRRVRDGAFPPPTELGVNSIGWPNSVISDWLSKRPCRTYTPGPAPAPEAA